MIFQLGKSKSSTEAKWESDQAPRWKQPSLMTRENDKFILNSEVDSVDSVRVIPSNPSAPAEEPVAAASPQWAVKVDAPAPRANTPTPINLVKAPDEEPYRKVAVGVKTAIAPGTIIEGRFTFDAPVKIDGDLTGEVVSTSTLIVGEQANVKAQIRVGSIVVYGKVIGDIDAQDIVEVKSGGHLESNISTDRIAIEEGAYFKGSVNLR